MTDIVVNFITSQGYLGVFLLMVGENLFPPIPSEVILPFVGHSAAMGEMNVYLAMIVATIGALCGTLFWFLVGWFAPAEKLKKFFRRYGGYIAISAKDFHKATDLFVKYEVPAVFFGRMIPGIRSVISIPAGSVRMLPPTFLFWTMLGLSIWNILLIFFGYVVFTDYTQVEKYIRPVADGITYLFIAIYVMQVLRFVFHRKKE